MSYVTKIEVQLIPKSTPTLSLGEVAEDFEKLGNHCFRFPGNDLMETHSVQDEKGTAGLMVIREEDSRRQISAILVRDDWMGKGVAAALLESAEKGTDKGKKLYVEIPNNHPFSEGLMVWYWRKGYTFAKVHPEFPGELVLCEKTPNP